jgi:glucan 1,3-beta-glucosidase
MPKRLSFPPSAFSATSSNSFAPNFAMILKQLLLIFAVLCGAQAKFWVEEIDHLGISPYHPEGSSYQIFRNVKDFGAIGDGGM